MLPVRSPPPHHRRLSTASDPAEAERILGEAFADHTIQLSKGVTSVDLDLVTARIGALTVGRVSYGRSVVVHTKATPDIHIEFTLRGQAEMGTGTGPMRMVEVGSAAVFPTGQPTHLVLSADCALLAVTVPRAAVEAELQHLLGQSLGAPLDLAFDLDLTTPLGKSWDPILKLLIEELRRPTALTQHPAAAKRIEGLLIDALLLGHDHNYRDLLDHGTIIGAATAVERAIQLIETEPTDEWSTDRLAREVHLSARALQAGFRRDVGMPPMDYVRQARLRHVHTALADGTMQATTVQAVAHRYGFVHLGRFAATYRDRYGESPVETLRRPPT